MIIWLTGLSGSGKSTLAEGLIGRLRKEKIQTLLIDGDLLRKELSRDLGFSSTDRSENIRRAAAIAILANQSGLMSICSLISPFRTDRAAVRALCLEHGVPFFEVFVNAPLSVCEERDPKGLYKSARAGLIPHFTGIDDPYEVPEKPELVINTADHSVEKSLEILTAFACRHFKQ